MLGSPGLEGQYGINWTGSIGVRSTLTARLTNEATFGVQGGTNILGSGLSPVRLRPVEGDQVSFASYMTNPYLGSYTATRRATPAVYQLNDNLSYPQGCAPAEFRRQLHPGGILAGRRQFVPAPHRRPGRRLGRSRQYRRHVALHHHQFPGLQPHPTLRRGESLCHPHRQSVVHHFVRGAQRSHQNLRPELQRGSRPPARFRPLLPGRLESQFEPHAEPRRPLG
ncbi:MAG: hypothetical protein WDO73_36965 [Ignavibacteriota bacterium]